MSVQSGVHHHYFEAVSKNIDTSELHRVLQHTPEESAIAWGLKPHRLIPTDQFRGALLVRGLVGIEAAHELFPYFQNYCSQSHQYDAIQHILVGDRAGGGHHPTTALELGYPMLIASAIRNSKIPRKMDIKSRRRNNYTDTSGVYASGHSQVVYSQAPGKVALKQSRLYGITAFPTNWTAEEVLRAAVRIYKEALEPTMYGVEGKSVVFEGRYKQVQMGIVASLATGRILTAHPIINKADRP